MSAAGICIVFLLFLFLAVPVTFGIIRDEKAKRAEWRPDGAGEWWHRPLRKEQLRQSVRLIDQPPPAETLEVKDPRKMRVHRLSRKLRAHRGTSPAARATFERTVVELGIRQEVP